MSLFISCINETHRVSVYRLGISRRLVFREVNNARIILFSCPRSRALNLCSCFHVLVLVVLSICPLCTFVLASTPSSSLPHSCPCIQVLVCTSTTRLQNVQSRCRFTHPSCPTRRDADASLMSLSRRGRSAGGQATGLLSPPWRPHPPDSRSFSLSLFPLLLSSIRYPHSSLPPSFPALPAVLHSSRPSLLPRPLTDTRLTHRQADGHQDGHADRRSNNSKRTGGLY